MAGGSTDAAAVLQGINKMFSLKLSDKELMDKLEALVREKVAALGNDEDINSMSDDDFEIKDFDDEL